MKGGDESPAMNSPMNQYRKRIATGPGIRGSGSQKATPLGRQALKNAYSKSQSPQPPKEVSPNDQKNVSPIRPQTLEFGESANVSPYTDI
jgi:hypothetical protein